MTCRIAINGFGRIGRGILRALLERDDTGVELVAVNDPAAPEQLLNLLKYDSIHGRLGCSAVLDDDRLVVDGRPVRLSARDDPSQLDWGDVDIALECSGRYTKRETAAQHLENGSQRVLVSAPCSGADRTVVWGVNHRDLEAEDLVVSNASCTTNCLAPVAMVLDREFGIRTGYMTTVHAYTRDQPSHDSPHRDPYRARAAALSMVPTSTGAARAISLVLPRLAGRLEGSAIRVPTPNVSLIDLSFMPERPAARDTVNEALRSAARGELAGILDFSEDPMVSIDFNHDAHSSCFAPAQTAVTDGGMVRVVSWYDNEWGFTNRMIDTAAFMADLSGGADTGPRLKAG